MKIPENFKLKYQLKGDSYPSANADAALSELYTVSGRLYKENADLKAELTLLRESAKNAPACDEGVDLSGLEHTVSGLEMMITALEAKIDSIKTALNDTLCVVNDAAISAKKAEESAKEAKAASEFAGSCAAEVKLKAEEILGAIEACGNRAEHITDETVPEIILEDIFEDEDEILPEAEEMPEELPAPEAAEEILLEEEEEILPEADAIEESEPEKEEEEEIPEAEEIPEEEPEEQKSEEAESDIADDLIRSAGLDSEPEEIEPAEPIDESDLSARLAKMYADTADEELPKIESSEDKYVPEEKHAPTSFTDMKTALDAIRARLKK